ncbi:MBL fold metallo-hydrolase [Pseudonocardia sp. WMMC193]|uniref:MBL fold metallo-hydrolase n=1 Tax=Pseudonocardia sp. WMMC193 TaxID=2911965 RepID=UPI001F3DF411|nr:MBL fold metallo-hydrolase [Pseudonocardia sp. WMMC193]MCF7552289.1 MBL fold metallo-hydrolase [Pseudonocardia sp. WMMC193]
MATDVGELADQASVRRSRMGEFTFTYVVDGSMWLAARLFLHSIPTAYWEEHPEQIGADGFVAMSAGGLLVETPDETLLIDAGLGDVRDESAVGRNDSGEFLTTLAALGVQRGDIDVFALTHLHVDHAGWAFLDGDDGRRVPAFPAARYVVAESELRPFRRGERPLGACDHDSVVEPMEGLPTLQRIADGEQISPGVTALVTPGHSAGHTSYIMTSSTGQRLIAFGDAFHVPAQLNHPEWGSAPDVAPELVPAARARLLDELCRPETWAFAIHFGDQPFGRVIRDSSGEVRWQPVATDVLAAPPRPPSSDTRQ